MSEIELFVDFHLDGDRQGPGSASATLQAINLTRIPKDKNVKIADIGCGSGAQTFILAQNLGGNIIAVDLFPQFLDKLNRKSKELGFQDKITTIVGSMDALPFVNEEFDLIWSEGAIYTMGFEAGIKQWRDYLKPGGLLAVSEMTWTTKSRPEELERHWENEYPEINTASAKIRILEENGYSPVGYFILPEECWLDNYYVPMERRFEVFLRRHNNSDTASSIVNAEAKEISLYRKYKEYINYGFYIAKKL